jgi:hypothetical protein
MLIAGIVPPASEEATMPTFLPQFQQQRGKSTKSVVAALTLAAALLVPVSATFAQEYYPQPDYGYEYQGPPPQAAEPVYVAPPAVMYSRPYYRPEVRYWHHWHRHYAPAYFHHRHGRW